MESAQWILALSVLLWCSRSTCWKNNFPRWRIYSISWPVMLTNFPGLWSHGMREEKLPRIIPLTYIQIILNWAAGVILQVGFSRGNCRFVLDLRYDLQMIGIVFRNPSRLVGVAGGSHRKDHCPWWVPHPTPPQFWSDQGGDESPFKFLLFVHSLAQSSSQQQPQLLHFHPVATNDVNVRS